MVPLLGLYSMHTIHLSMQTSTGPFIAVSCLLPTIYAVVNLNAPSMISWPTRGGVNPITLDKDHSTQTQLGAFPLSGCSPFPRALARKQELSLFFSPIPKRIRDSVAFPRYHLGSRKTPITFLGCPPTSHSLSPQFECPPSYPKKFFSSPWKGMLKKNQKTKTLTLLSCKNVCLGHESC